MDDDGAELRSGGSGRWARPAGRAVLLVTLALAWACGAPAGPEPRARVFASKEAAAQAVADAIASRDGARLTALAVSEREFRARVWPALPASRAEVGMPADYVWADTSAKSRGHLAQILQEHGGQPLAVERVSFSGPPVDYGAFRIHPKASLTVRQVSGARAVVRLFGSMMETDGGWTIFSYIVD